MSAIEHFIFIIFAWIIASLFFYKYNWQILTLLGAIGLLFVAPYSFAVLFFTGIEGILLNIIAAYYVSNRNLRQYMYYILFINLYFVDFGSFFFENNLETLGISFGIVRIFMTIKEISKFKFPVSKRDYIWVFVAAFYLPAIVVGPVFSGLLIRNQSISSVRVYTTIRDHRNLLLGLVLCVSFGSIFQELKQVPVIDGSVTSAYLGVIYDACVSFLLLFVTFWGHSLISETSSKFFGFRLPRNFDRPWKAKDIRDFWRRWHVSMADFVMQYIFLPLQLRGVGRRAAIIWAFVFMGLWHKLTVEYFLWGLAHGSLLALWPVQVNVEQRVSLLPAIFRKAVLFVAVIGLSYMANHLDIYRIVGF